MFKINIDIRRLVSLLTYKTCKQKIYLGGVNCSDSKTVADY